MRVTFLARDWKVAPFYRLLWIFVAASALAAPSKPPAESIAAVEWVSACQPTPWRSLAQSAITPQEDLRYAVRWGILTAGKGRMRVDGLETINGRPAYRLGMDLETTGVTAKLHHYSDHLASWLDQVSLQPVHALKMTRQPGYHFDDTVIFDQACRRYYRHQYRGDKGRTTEKQGDLAPDTVDLLSYIFYLRTLPLEPGARFPLHLLTSDKAVSVTVVVRKREKISTPAGTFDTFFLEPEFDPAEGKKVKEVQLWLSADARRLPVKIRLDVNIGHIVAELTRHQP
jgi:hypothetical protein